MTSVWDRHNPRVNYQVPVGVVDPDKRQVLSMVSINLSAGGMFVDTSEELSVGTELVCNLPIGDTQAMQVRARVAWQRSLGGSDARRPRGVGIEFIDLSVDEAAHLAQVVGVHEELSHAARLHVDGMKGAINAEVQLTPHGIFFRSPLPFLGLNSQVDFAFEGDEGNETYQGRIVDVKVDRDLDSAVPRLQIEVELLTSGSDEHEIPCAAGTDAIYEVMHIDLEDTIPNPMNMAVDVSVDDAIDKRMNEERGEPAFVHGAGRASVAACAAEKQAQPFGNEEPTYFDAEESDVVEELEEEQERAAESDPILLVMPKRQPKIHDASLYDSLDGAVDGAPAGSPARERRLWLGAAAAVALVVCVVWTSGSSRDTKPKLDNGEGSLLSQGDSEHAREAERVRALIEGPERTPNDEHASSVVEDRQIASEETQAMVVSPPATGGPALAAKAEVPRPVKAKEKPTPVALEKAASEPVRAVKQQTIGGIQMREDSAGLTVRIPITGSLKDARHYLLADPVGIAMNLPYAQPAKGYHESLSPESDAVRRIWVRERLGGIHMRVYFAGDAPSCDVEYRATEVLVRCKH